MVKPLRVSSADDLRKELDSGLSQLSIFGALIVVVHLLNIIPSEVTTLGAKFTISDPVILRGALAVVFLNKLHILVVLMRASRGIYTTEDVNKAAGRSAIMRHRKRGRSIVWVKRFAKADMYIWVIIAMPWILLLVAFYASAFVLSLCDAYDLTGFCLSTKTAFGRFIQSTVY